MQNQCGFSKALADISNSSEALVAGGAAPCWRLIGSVSHVEPGGGCGARLCTEPGTDKLSLHLPTALLRSILSPSCVRCTRLLATCFISQRY